MEGTRLQYLYVFNFEKSYSYVDSQKWLPSNLLYYGWITFYFVIIVSGILYMADKPKYNLRRLHALWCGLNALFSIMGFIRTVPELLFALIYRSLYYSVCIPSNYFQNPVSGFWTWALILSKFIQLCDTIFIVLKKQEVTFLHIYRRLFVIPYFRFAYMQTTAIMRWFSVMEYLLYSWMYSYHALTAMQFKLPIYFAATINAMQIVQTLINCIIIVMAYNQQDIYKLKCYITYRGSVVGIIYNLISCIFHIKFFYSTYISKEHKKKARKID